MPQQGQSPIPPSLALPGHGSCWIKARHESCCCRHSLGAMSWPVPALAYVSPQGGAWGCCCPAALLLAGVVEMWFCCLFNSPWEALTIMDSTPALRSPLILPTSRDLLQDIPSLFSRLNSPNVSNCLCRRCAPAL